MTRLNNNTCYRCTGFTWACENVNTEGSRLAFRITNILCDFQTVEPFDLWSSCLILRPSNCYYIFQAWLICSSCRTISRQHCPGHCGSDEDYGCPADDVFLQIMKSHTLSQYASMSVEQTIYIRKVFRWVRSQHLTFSNKKVGKLWHQMCALRCRWYYYWYTASCTDNKSKCCLLY